MHQKGRILANGGAAIVGGDSLYVMRRLQF